LNKLLKGEKRRLKIGYFCTKYLNIMIRQINELYENYVREGKKVVEILISYISYDHLKSELNNIKEKPEWIEKLNIQKDISGFKIVADGI
jgi:hypothetical protein